MFRAKQRLGMVATRGQRVKNAKQTVRRLLRAKILTDKAITSTNRSRQSVALIWWWFGVWMARTEQDRG